MDITRAAELAKQAVALDEGHKYREAYAKYKLALDYFTLVLKYEKNEAPRRTIRGKMDEYSLRIGTLEGHLFPAGDVPQDLVKRVAVLEREVEDLRSEMAELRVRLNKEDGEA